MTNRLVQTVLLTACGSLMLADHPVAYAADLEMVDAFGNITGVVDLSAAGVSVFENNGARWFYRREPRYDVPGGMYLGFYSLELNRAIRFPRGGVGPIQRADLDSPLPQFVPASVSVRLIGSGRGFLPYLDAWQIPPPVGAQRMATPYGLSSPGYGGPYGGSIAAPAPTVGGMPLRPRTPVVPLISQYQSQTIVSPRTPSPVVGAAPLSKVEVTLLNTQSDRLRVTIRDVQNPGKEPQYDIPPGGSQRVKLPRDADGIRLETRADPTGRVFQAEVRFSPPARYEVIVHRWRIQSIAIDRTGTSPQPIEDVHFQGVGVGRFMLPPGEQLTSGVIDVFAAATASNNPGSVAPIITRQ